MPLIYPERLNLARRPTPLQLLPGLSRRYGKEIRVWRDDLTGWELSGNKIRKLEFLCAQALGDGANHLVTCGGPQSNHARATAFAARRMGWEVTVVVREPSEGFDREAPPTGNLLLNELLGVNFVYVPFSEYQAQGGVYDSFLEQAARELSDAGKRPFVIPEGGSCPMGCWGYLAAMEELLIEPGDQPFDLFCAIGSGGTFAGLELGRALLAPETRLHGVNVCDSAEHFQQRIGRLLTDTVAVYSANGIRYSPQPLTIYDGFVGSGYAQASDDDLRFYRDLAIDEGILLDPVYTGKAFRGMLYQLTERPGDFHDDIIFLHSGGQFATFAFSEQYHRAING
jgi:D-cysteine desulfhydrase